MEATGPWTVHAGARLLCDLYQTFWELEGPHVNNIISRYAGVDERSA